MTSGSATDVSRLIPYVPNLFRTWSPTGFDERHMRVNGTLAFVDISGFTRLTERLARRGKVGAEEMSDILSSTFSGLLRDADADGADLVKWGGDAVLLLFRGPAHAARAARAAHRMRATMRRIGRIETSSGTVVLRMSMGVHSDDFDFFLVGDPDIHRELLISGPGASLTATIEAAASAGQIGLSAATTALLPQRVLGPRLLDGRLLRLAPAVPERALLPEQVTGLAPADALPPPIRAHLLDGPGEPEHRVITVGFVQFSGSDALLQSAGPTALAAALDDVVRNVQRACADHDVTFFETDINRDGGKVMLTAGAPRSADHNEERLLRVARRVLDRAGRLPLRIGINRGHVFAGDFGPPFRRTYSVKGDAINLAARVMGKARPGQVLATTGVLTGSQTLFAMTELPPFMVKGKSQPVLAAEVDEILGTREDQQLGLGLVGRAAELDVLRAALADVRAGRGRAVEVVGEAGIGKSRIVTELLIENAELPVLSTRCEAYESSTAYFPFRKVLRDALAIPAGADVAEHLAWQVSRLAPHLEPWLPLLAVPLDVEVPATPETADLDEQFRKARLEAVVSELLAAATPDTTVIVLEDTHAMDEASADLLERLVADLDRRSWLVLVTRRENASPLDTDQDQDVNENPNRDEARSSLRVGPLAAEATLEITQRAMGEHPLTPHAMEALARRSGGNPMFLEALVREVSRAGDLADLPDSVEGLVTSEIDRLSPEDRRVLRYAAVLGAVVDEVALGRLLAEGGGDTSVPRRLEGFLVRGQSGRLRFRNALLRDVAYEGLSYRSRRQLHHRAGEAIERASSDPEAQCEVLSLHFFHAGEQKRAWHYSVLAGRRAVAKLAHGEAVEFFARAVQAAPRDGSVTPDLVAEAYEQLADSRFLLGLTDEAITAYAQARRLLRHDPVRRAGLIEKEVRLDHRRRRFSQAMRRLSRGLRELDGLPGHGAAVARSLLTRRYAYSRFCQGRIDEALHWAEAAARTAEDSLDKEALAQAYEMLNAIYAGSGREEPLPYGRLALQANRELGDLAPQGHCLNNLAVEAFTHGRWNEALASYREAADIFRRIGDAASEGNAAYNQAELLVRQRRLAEAAELLPQVLRIARAVEDEELVALALRERAQTLAGSGDVTAAVAMLRETRGRFNELDEPLEGIITDVVLTEVLLDAGRSQEAAQILGAVLEDPGAGDLDGVGPRVRRLAARLHAAGGRPGEARSELLAGLQLAETEADRYEQALLLRELVALGHEEHGAEQRATRAAEILGSMGVVSAR